MVTLRWRACLAITVAALLSSATLLKAALTDPPPEPAQTFLAGQLLVASPSMTDPRFSQTVILMVQHDRTGALGVVINRPLRERPIADILEAFGEKLEGVQGRIRIFAGGPVEPTLGFIVHSPEYRRGDAKDIGNGMALSRSVEILRDIAAGKGPEKKLIALGYAGWAPGQLEGELKLDAWFTLPADPKVVFDDDREKLWHNAVARRPRDI